MAQWAVTFNGFGTQGVNDAGASNAAYKWTHVNITQYSEKPVFSDDGISIESTAHTITGTAMISRATRADFRTAILNARQRLSNQQHIGATTAVLVYLDEDEIETEMSSGKLSAAGPGAGIDATINDHRHTNEIEGPSRVVYYGSMEDDYGLPTCEFTINEIYGTLTAVVGFTISWHKLEPLKDATYHVLSHTWTQSYSVEEAGLVTMTITGSMRCRYFIEGKNFDFGTSGPFRGSNPDQYRTLVMPAIPNGFRVESMRWATDDTGSRLNYEVVLKEHARGLPYPAKTGDGSFSYVRDMAGSMLGTKTFEGTLEGDSNTSPILLLNALIRVAATRIFFGGATGPNQEQKLDVIQSIQVTENDIFSKRSITLRIRAEGYQTDEPTGFPGGDPGFNLLKPFVSDDGLSQAPNVYGSALIGSVKRQMFVPWDPRVSDTSYENNEGSEQQAFPKAKWIRANQWEGSGQYYVLPDEEDEGDDSPPPPLDEGEEHGADTVSTGHDTEPYTHVEGTETIISESNIVVMSGQSIHSRDSLYQMSRPRVRIVSEYELIRLHRPPSRIMLNRPDCSVVLSETFDIKRGQVDANNNRAYVGVYRREIEMVYQGVDECFFYKVKLDAPGWGTSEFVAWWPSSLYAPVDPRVEGNNQSGTITRTIFSVTGEGGGSGDGGRDAASGSGTKPWELGRPPGLSGSEGTGV